MDEKKTLMILFPMHYLINACRFLGRGLLTLLDYDTWKPRRSLYDPSFTKGYTCNVVHVYVYTSLVTVLVLECRIFQSGKMHWVGEEGRKYGMMHGWWIILLYMKNLLALTVGWVVYYMSTELMLLAYVTISFIQKLVSLAGSIPW